jgi:hypothetical protein
MAEETLYCPACNQKVRVPEELLGQPVQCPLCRLIFTAPVRGSAPPTVLPVPPPATGAQPPVLQPQPLQQVNPGTTTPLMSVSPEQREAIRRFVQVPGMVMLVIGVLSLLVDIYRVMETRGMGVQGMAEMMEKQNEMMERWGMPAQRLDPGFLYNATVILGCVFIVLRLFTTFAGIQMCRLRGYGMALTGSILTAINILDCPCCLLSAPVGIWALVILFRSDVRSAFE